MLISSVKNWSQSLPILEIDLRPGLKQQSAHLKVPLKSRYMQGGPLIVPLTTIGVGLPG